MHLILPRTRTLPDNFAAGRTTGRSRLVTRSRPTPREPKAVLKLELTGGNLRGKTSGLVLVTRSQRSRATRTLRGTRRTR